MSVEKPFQQDGAPDGAVPPSGSVHVAPQQSFADEEAPAAGNVAATPVEPRCGECGAGRHATRVGWCANEHDFCWAKDCGKGPHPSLPNRCAGGHLQLFNTEAVIHNGYSKRSTPIDADSVWLASLGGHRYAVLCKVFAAFEQKTLQFAEGARLRASDLKHLSSMFDGLRTTHAELSAIEDSMSQEEAWRKVARVFMRRADEFTALVCEVLAAHPEFAPTLRAALDAHDAQAQPEAAAPVPSAALDGAPRRVADEPDEVLL